MTLNTAICEELLIKFDEGALKEKGSFATLMTLS